MDGVRFMGVLRLRPDVDVATILKDLDTFIADRL